MNPKAFFKMSYGMFVVCSKDGEKTNGQIANTVIQVASEPAIIAVAIVICVLVFPQRAGSHTTSAARS